MKKSIIVILATVIILSVMWINASKEEKTPVFDVYTISPQKKHIYDYVNAEGRIKEGTKRDIYVKKLAQIGDIFVKEGQTVKKGSPLFEINPIEGEFSSENYNIDEYQVFEIFEEYGFKMPDKDDFSFITDEESIVTSPIEGIITDINIQKGENVNVIKKLVSVSDFSDLYIDTLIPEAYSTRIKPGAEVKITAEAFGDTSYSGKIESVSPVAKYIPSITGDGRTYISAVLRTNSRNTLFKPELTVKAKITVNTTQNALTIPYECIRQNDDGSEYVFCVKKGNIVKQGITTGQELEYEVEVKSGISEESIIVYNPTEELKEGVSVNIQNAAEKNNVST